MASNQKVLMGTQAIAEFLGIKRRQVLHLTETGRLPHYKIGRSICANPKTLTAWLEDQERATAQGGN